MTTCDEKKIGKRIERNIFLVDVAQFPLLPSLTLSIINLEESYVCIIAINNNKSGPKARERASAEVCKLCHY